MAKLRAGSLVRGAKAIEKAAESKGREEVEEWEDEQEKSIETMPWDEFLPYFKGVWKQGEHVTLVAPTGQGKTTLAREILPVRKYSVVFVTKAKDPLIRELEKDGYREVEQFIGQPEIYPKQLLAPPLKKGPDSMPDQRKVFKSALYQVFAAGKWCVYFDELRYITDNLALTKEVEFLLLQGRALKISLVASTQRPVKIPLEFFDQATHLFLWRDNDETNRRRIGGIGGTSGAILWTEVAQLKRHEFIYLNTRTQFICKSKVNLAGKKG